MPLLLRPLQAPWRRHHYAARKGCRGAANARIASNDSLAGATPVAAAEGCPQTG